MRAPDGTLRCPLCRAQSVTYAQIPALLSLSVRAVADCVDRLLLKGGADRFSAVPGPLRERVLHEVRNHRILYGGTLQKLLLSPPFRLSKLILEHCVNLRAEDLEAIGRAGVLRDVERLRISSAYYVSDDAVAVLLSQPMPRLFELSLTELRLSGGCLKSCAHVRSAARDAASGAARCAGRSATP